MDPSDEMLAVLREMRDLQKAHFERYKEFTQHMEAREREQFERSVQQQNQLAQMHLEDREYREHMRAAVSRGERHQQDVRGAFKNQVSIAMLIAVVLIAVWISTSSLGFGLYPLAVSTRNDAMPPQRGTWSPPPAQVPDSSLRSE